MNNYEQELKEREVRQRKWDAVISAEIAEVECALLKQHPGFLHTMLFGSMRIDPKHLAIWCFFKMDNDLRIAKEEHFTEVVNQAMRDALQKHGYPQFLLPTFSSALQQTRMFRKRAEATITII